jgi:transcriptional regulator with XRE-family HTH domain
MMMSNRIAEIVEETRRREGITYREIAERCGIPEQTLHSSRKRADMGRIGIDVFLKIAHGFGMTAEELYYGTDASNPSRSPEVRHLVELYLDCDVRGKRAIVRTAEGEAGMEGKSEADVIKTA